ncbi:hypothetical protein A7X75_02585 [Stenotrophomonas maltophilia]|nr:hypothetical protein A7X75_02585 [Stenotrophomonas maltophilia]
MLDKQALSPLGIELKTCTIALPAAMSERVVLSSFFFVSPGGLSPASAMLPSGSHPPRHQSKLLCLWLQQAGFESDEKIRNRVIQGAW